MALTEVAVSAGEEEQEEGPAAAGAGRKKKTGRRRSAAGNEGNAIAIRTDDGRVLTLRPNDRIESEHHA